MKKLLLVLLFTAMGMGEGLTQTLIQTYTDRCTGETKIFSVPLQGETIVTFYNKSRSVSAQDIYNGSFQAWLEETYQWWSSLSPCSTSQAATTQTQQQTQQTAQDAANAASNATSANTNVPNTTNNPPTNTGTNEPQTNNNQATTGQNQQNQNNTSSKAENTNSQTGDENSSNSDNGQTSNDSQSNNDESTSTNENTTGGETDTQEENTEQNSDDTTSEDESESEPVEENTEEESEEDQQEENQDEESEEESENESEESDEKDDNQTNKKKKKKKKKNLTPPIISANLLSQQNLFGGYDFAINLGISRSSLMGDKTYSLNAQVFQNLKQFSLAIGYSKVFLVNNRPKWVWSSNLNGSRIFANTMVAFSESIVHLGTKGSVTGLSVSGTSLWMGNVLENKMLTYIDQILGLSVTSFYTKPFNFDRLSFSPMLAASYGITSNSITGRTIIPKNKDVMFIVGSNFNYALTKRFNVNLGSNIIKSTAKEFPYLINFTIGSRFSF